MAGTADEGWDDDHGTAVAGPDYLDDVAKSDPDFESEAGTAVASTDYVDNIRASAEVSTVNPLPDDAAPPAPAPVARPGTAPRAPTMAFGTPVMLRAPAGSDEPAPPPRLPGVTPRAQTEPGAPKSAAQKPLMAMPSIAPIARPGAQTPSAGAKTPAPIAKTPAPTPVAKAPSGGVKTPASTFSKTQALEPITKTPAPAPIAKAATPSGGVKTPSPSFSKTQTLESITKAPARVAAAPVAPPIDDGSIDDTAGDLDAFDHAETIGQPGRVDAPAAPPRRLTPVPISALRALEIAPTTSDVMPAMPDPLAATILANPSPSASVPKGTQQHASVPAPMSGASAHAPSLFSATPSPFAAAAPSPFAATPGATDAGGRPDLAAIAAKLLSSNGSPQSAVETELVRKSSRKRGLVIGAVVFAAVALGIVGALVLKSDDAPSSSAATSSSTSTTPTGPTDPAQTATAPAAPTNTEPAATAAADAATAEGSGSATATATAEPAAAPDAGTSETKTAETPAETKTAETPAETKTAETPAEAKTETKASVTKAKKPVAKAPVRKATKKVAKRPPVKRPPAKKKKAACSGLDCL